MPATEKIKVYKKDFMQPGYYSNSEDRQGYLSSLSVFDRNGNIIEEVSYYSDGKIEHRNLYAYNVSGTLCEEVLYGEDNELEEKRRYEYDDTGKILKELFYYLDDSYDVINFIYNEEGKLIEKCSVDSDQEPENKEVFHYADNLLIRDAVYDYSDTLLSENLYEYNELGKVLQHIRRNYLQETYSRFVYEYNEHGVKTMALEYNSENQLISKDTFEENQDGQLIRAVEEDQYSKNTIEFKYDAHGNITEQIETNNHGELNHQIIRVFNENNQLVEHSVTIDRHGNGANQKFILTYEYEVYSDVAEE